MHSALLIDEILRQVFYFAENDRSSLLSSACSCKAWKDPALDFIWDRLSSFGPLLLLLPGVSLRNGEYVFGNRPVSDDLAVFKSYARRVRHINHRQEVKLNPGISALSPFTYAWKTALPNLKTAHIAMPKCTSLLMPLSLSPTLRHLDIDLGFKPTSPFMDTAVCEYLEQARACCLHLRQLSLRGIASERLNTIVSRMDHLHTISLRLGRSLSPDTLMAIMTFPHLLELEIHAGHINDYDLDAIPCSSTTFASLGKLCIRAKTPLIETIMQHIPSNTLCHLQIDLDDPDASSTSWNTIFTSISDQTTHTLNYFSLEHHFEVEESTSSIPSDANQTTPGRLRPSMTFETLHILRGLKHLRHFSCDVTLPPAVNDRDIEKLVVWWPNLEYFALGSAPLNGDVDGGMVRPPQITTTSLTFFATKLPKLRKLIMPLMINDSSNLSVIPMQAMITNELQELAIGHLKTSNPLELARYLRSLFPALETFEGVSDEAGAYASTNDALRIVPKLV